MFTRPSLFPVSTIFGTLVLVCLIQQTPLTDDYGFWSGLIDPLGRAFSTLREARGFVAPSRNKVVVEEYGRIDDLWRTIAAQPNASLFRQLFFRATPAGRLYALVGLYHLHSRSLPAAQKTARSDVAEIALWDLTITPSMHVRLKDVSDSTTLSQLDTILFHQ